MLGCVPVRGGREGGMSFVLEIDRKRGRVLCQDATLVLGLVLTVLCDPAYLCVVWIERHE